MLRTYKVQKLLDLFNLFLKYKSQNFVGRYTAKISHKYNPFSLTSTITCKSFWFFKKNFCVILKTIEDYSSALNENKFTYFHC